MRIIRDIVSKSLIVPAAISSFSSPSAFVWTFSSYVRKGRMMQRPTRSLEATAARSPIPSAYQVDGDLILGMLHRMTKYLENMVDPQSNRFFYRCSPESGRRVHRHCPIRDMGSAWDTATLLRFWKGYSNSAVPATAADGETKSPLIAVERWKASRARLSAAILATIDAYSGSWAEFEDSHYRQCAAVPASVLREPSNIAHSAFLTLACIGALRLSIVSLDTLPVPMNMLVNGILSMQVEGSGAFAIHFGQPSDIYGGIEFYPGEAMLALMDAYELSAKPVTSKKEVDCSIQESKLIPASTQKEIIASMQRAFRFYSDYYRSGNVDAHYISFFGNWQVQCFAKLAEILLREKVVDVTVTDPVGAKKPASGSPTLAADKKEKIGHVHTDVTAVADYVYELCDAIVSSNSWRRLAMGQYSTLSTVEIACGLEAIAEASRLALLLSSESVSGGVPSDTSNTSSDDTSTRVRHYWRYVVCAVHFLAEIQNQVPEESSGSGGLGHALTMQEQRLDVTGHAVNAITKVHGVQQSAIAFASSNQPHDGKKEPVVGMDGPY